MIKSKFCDTHFAMGCKLCAGDEPEPQSPLSSEAQNIAQKITSESVAPVPMLEPQNFIPHDVPVPPKSEEAQAVLSITDEYAKSCDDLKRANDAVTAMHQHIDKMESMLKELLADVVLKKKNKDELKRKVLETLAMGSD